MFKLRERDLFYNSTIQFKWNVECLAVQFQYYNYPHVNSALDSLRLQQSKQLSFGCPQSSGSGQLGRIILQFSPTFLQSHASDFLPCFHSEHKLSVQVLSEYVLTNQELMFFQSEFFELDLCVFTSICKSEIVRQQQVL